MISGLVFPISVLPAAFYWRDIHVMPTAWGFVLMAFHMGGTFVQPPVRNGKENEQNHFRICRLSAGIVGFGSRNIRIFAKWFME